MLKKFKRIAFWLVFLTLYFNIGWGLGYYYHYNVITKTFESASWHAKLAGGHCELFGKGASQIELEKNRGPLFSEAVSSFIWPLFLLLSLCSWAGHIFLWIFKFIFAGGLFKLVFGIP